MTTPLSLDLLDTRLRPLCDAYLATAQVPGASIAVVMDDKAYHYAYGVKSIITGAPVTAQTGFNIGSCSKAFVSATLASLIADGLATWDDPIAKYVPEFQLHDPWVTQHATLRDLSANRLGLPRAGLVEYGFDPSVSNLATFEGLRHTQPQYPFRDRFTYVNTGHTANAVAAGRISGKGFLTTLGQRILEPLGMSTTSGGAAARDELQDQAAWHCVVEGKVVSIDTVFTDMYLGGGGMVVSGRDALQWLRLHLNAGKVDGRQIIPVEALAETHTGHAAARPGRDAASLFYPGAHVGSYALGWAVSDFEGHPLLCHSGGDFGITAMTLLLPKAGIGIAVYCNRSGGNATATAYALAAALLGRAPHDWGAYFASLAPVTATAPPAQHRAWTDLSVYAGNYSHPADGLLVIEHAGNELRGSFKNGYRMNFTLAANGGHRFAIWFAHPEWQAGAERDRASLLFTVADGLTSGAEVQVAGFAPRVFNRVADMP